MVDLVDDLRRLGGTGSGTEEQENMLAAADVIASLRQENERLHAALNRKVQEKVETVKSLKTAQAELAKLREGAEPVVVATFQDRVQPWMMACFGPEISADRLERNDRFIEEALELVQASDYPKERALALVDYVYDRDQGEINQEVGGVMVTLAAHCLAHGVDMHAAAETELARIWTKVDKIRAKQAAKPTGSALPVALSPAAPEGLNKEQEKGG